MQFAEYRRRTEKQRDNACDRGERALPGFARALDQSLDGDGTLVADQPAELRENLAARRVRAEDEPRYGNRDDEQGGDREDRVIRERCTHARRVVLGPLRDRFLDERPKRFDGDHALPPQGTSEQLPRGRDGQLAGDDGAKQGEANSAAICEPSDKVSAPASPVPKGWRENAASAAPISSVVVRTTTFVVRLASIRISCQRAPRGSCPEISLPARLGALASAPGDRSLQRGSPADCRRERRARCTDLADAQSASMRGVNAPPRRKTPIASAGTGLP